MIQGILLVTPKEILSQQWYSVKSGKFFGISGMALIEQSDDFFFFLIVHDNKEKDNGRLAIVAIEDKKQPRYFPLIWPDDTDLPVDLESLTFVPGGKEPSFIALTSIGKLYHIKLNTSRTSISILKVFGLPEVSAGSNFEGFSLQKFGNKLLAVWAHRGKGEQAAVIYWGLFDISTYKFSQISSISLKVPWPVKPDVRHVSDLKVDSSGVLFISSASDPGDEGPFQSAVYIAGTFSFCNNKVIFQPNIELVRMYHFENHKVEAFDLVPGELGGIIFATDDENIGSFVYPDW